MDDDPSCFDLDIGVGRAAYQTGRVDTMVTAHRIEKLAYRRKDPAFALADTSPFDIRGVVILFITGDLTAAASHTGGRIKVKPVVLIFLKLRKIYTIVSALHSRLSLIIDKLF